MTQQMHLYWESHRRLSYVGFHTRINNRIISYNIIISVLIGCLKLSRQHPCAWWLWDFHATVSEVVAQASSLGFDRKKQALHGQSTMAWGFSGFKEVLKTSQRCRVLRALEENCMYIGLDNETFLRATRDLPCPSAVTVSHLGHVGPGRSSRKTPRDLREPLVMLQEGIRYWWFGLTSFGPYVLDNWNQLNNWDLVMTWYTLGIPPVSKAKK